MNRKLISRFLTLGMLLGVLTFGMNIVSASTTHHSLNECLDECEAQYSTAICLIKVGPFTIQKPGCAIAMAHCQFDCYDEYGQTGPVVISPH